jgi:class 3 adenylate cyclase
MGFHSSVILLAGIFLALGMGVWGKTVPDARLQNLQKGYSTAGTDSLKIIALGKIAFYYYDVLNQPKPADSVSEIAIRLAELSSNPELLLFAYNIYLESNDLGMFYEKAVGYGDLALQLSLLRRDLRMEWRTCHNLAAAHLERLATDKALEFSNRAFSIANTLDDEALRIESFLDLGRSLEYKNQKFEAFSNYLLAIEMAEKLNNDRLLAKCYSYLSGYYNLNKIFDRAKIYKMKQGAVVKRIQPLDSNALMWVEYDLQNYLIRGNNQVNDLSIRNIIEYALRNDNQRLKIWEFSVYRKYLIDRDRIDLLYELYNKRYPAELKALETDDPTMYYRINAFFKEYEGKIDSADYYFRKTEDMMKRETNALMASNFYNRYGQFLVRHDRDPDAVVKFTKAYELAKSSRHYVKMEFMLSPAKQLEKLYEKMGDYKNAYAYAVIDRNLTDSINVLTRKDEVIQLQISREATQKEHQAEMEKQRNERTIKQRRMERNMMAGGVLTLFIVSLLIYRNFKNQKRLNRLLDIAKKKSDELLLNILPLETAEELKVSGSAKAKRFEEVTVMFTDFKDFTQVSEAMSAENLVEVIHYYFSEFDRIIQLRHLEKIKIIGDSYMCVGGLPVSNETHASDVVNAALDLQAFMMAEKRSRMARGEAFFELRIGIHTGPVVAGIVGTRKFAYDIWGDTVNTASRMENAGEINRVNISGQTYERIKNRFICTYRGKVQAKHKGEIDMYFVDGLA